MGHKIHNVISVYVDGVRDGHLFAALDKYVEADLIQHSPGIAGGRDGLFEAYYPLVARYDRRFIQPLRGFEDGRWVFLHTFQSFGYRDVERVNFDIFDTDDDDHIIEHWGVTAPLSPASAAGCSQIDGPMYVENLTATAANKQLIEAYLVDVVIGGHRSRADRYVRPDCIEHAAAVTGAPSADRPGHDQVSATTYVDVAQVVGSGNYVATLSNVMTGAQRRVVGDLYRVECGQIVERWSTSQPA